MKLTILGQLPRKSNSRRIVPVKGTNRHRSIKSQQALDYEDDFNKQLVARQRQNLEGDLEITGTIYYQSKRSDLSEELLFDCLERADVISNDRMVVHKNIWKKIDRKNPRVEIEINQLENYVIEGE